jgi:hypothetical protein
MTRGAHESLMKLATMTIMPSLKCAKIIDEKEHVGT